MQLTPTQKQQYLEEGYTVVRGLISPEEIAPAREQLRALLHGELDWPPQIFHVLDPQKFTNARGGMVPVGAMMPSQQDESFARIADHPHLQDAMKTLLGETARRTTDQAILRGGALKGGETFYHQDSFYWRLEPEIGCNCWITFDHVGPNAGALAILPGSHKSWTLTEHEQYLDEPPMHSARTGKVIERFRIPRDTIDSSGEVLLSMQPGDAAFFSNFTWHRAEPNLSGQDLFAYAPAYQKDHLRPE